MLAPRPGAGQAGAGLVTRIGRDHVLNPALGYNRFAELVKTVEPFVAASAPSFAGYESAVVGRRLLQRLVDVGLQPFLRHAAYRAQLRLDPFCSRERTLRCGGLTFNLQRGCVAVGASLWLRSLGSFVAHWARILWRVSWVCLCGARRDRNPATLVFGVGQGDIVQRGSDERFARFCRNGPVPPLATAGRLIVQSSASIASSQPKWLCYAKHPLFALLAEWGMTPTEVLRFIVEHFAILAGYLRACISWAPLSLLARDLAFHALVAHLNRAGALEATVITNSDYHLQPLWMRALSGRRFATHMVWYSQNSFPFVYKADGVRSYLPNHRYIEVDHIWVWTPGFAHYLNKVGARGTCHVVGPILWYLPEKTTSIGRTPVPRISVFDVTPMTPASAHRFGLLFNYYSVENTIAFVRDILAVRDDLEERHRCRIEVLIKHKRTPTGIHDRAYLDWIRAMSESGRIRLVPPDTNIYSMVSESIVAVTIPYSSPAYVAAALGIPSIFYDPTGTLVPSYEEVHGLQYAAGISDLRTALNAAFEASTTTQP